MINNNSSEPLLSIGMPVFNMQDTVGSAIESVLHQTYTNFELVISDNNSTDCTFDICQKYALSDPRIRLFRQPVNKGGAVNFEFVLNQSRGIYFAWMAGDDVLSNNWLEALIPYAKEAWVFGRVVQIGCPDKVDYHNKLIASRLSYDGCKLFRKISFLCSNTFSGTANIIYGLTNRKVFQELLSKSHFAYAFSDIAFLYYVLGMVPIKQVTNIPTYLYKRMPPVPQSSHLQATPTRFLRALNSQLDFLIREPIAIFKAIAFNRLAGLTDWSIALISLPVIIMRRVAHLLSKLLNKLIYSPLRK